MNLREELIREAEAAIADLEEHSAIFSYPERMYRVKKSHARLLAFIKGQTAIGLHGALVTNEPNSYCFTDPETLP